MLTLRNDFWKGLDPIFDSVFKGYTYPVFRHIGANQQVQFKTRTEGEDVIIEAALPGYTKDEVDIDVTDGILTLSSVKETMEEGTSGTSSFKTSFIKQYTLPKYEGKLETEAKMENGILRLVLKGLYKELPFTAPKAFKIPIE